MTKRRINILEEETTTRRNMEKLNYLYELSKREEEKELGIELARRARNKAKGRG